MNDFFKGWTQLDIKHLAPRHNVRSDWPGLVKEAAGYNVKVYQGKNVTMISFPDWPDNDPDREKLSDFRVRFIAALRSFGIDNLDW